MNTGIVKLFPAFAGSTETTVEEMRTYLLDVVTKFCQLTGLSLINTLENDYGADYIIGEEGATQGIIAIGNYNYSSVYYNQIYISRLGADNTILFTHTTSATAATAYGAGYKITNGIWMKYFKDSSSLCFGFLASSSSSGSFEPLYYILKMKKGEIERKIFGKTYPSSMYLSYDTLLNNENTGSSAFNYSGTAYPFVPESKEAIADIYLSNDVELPYMKFFTNRKGFSAWETVVIDGEKYVVGTVATWTLLLKVNDPVDAE